MILKKKLCINNHGICLQMKSRILLIFQYLWEHTDEAHTVSLEKLKDQSYLSEDAKVELLCENALMGSIIDRLGEDISVQIVDKEHFKVTATMALSNTFYGWGFASGGKMRIFGPEKVREQFQAIPDNFSV